MERTLKSKRSEDLTQEEFSALLEELEKFENNFFIALAGTDRFEIVPTSEGEYSLTKDQLNIIKAECSNLGLKIIYKVESKGPTIYINQENGKIGYTHDGVH
jgi:hypothetical protein